MKEKIKQNIFIYYMIFKFLKLLSTVLVERIVSSDVACMYSKSYAATIQDIAKIKQTKQNRRKH